MKVVIRLPLRSTPEQAARLLALRAIFAKVCNRLAPAVQSSRVWNRVALHHLHYHTLRQQFPNLGSQMVCNAIYAVSKMAKLVYQHPHSPYNLTTRGDGPLPLLRFAESCPVYFDRHTLSIKGNQLSLFTMDGRIHFEFALAPKKRELFVQAKSREIILKQRIHHVFELTFLLEPDGVMVPKDEPDRLSPKVVPVTEFLPNYVSVEVAQ